MQAMERYEISPLKPWSLLQRQLAASGQTKGSAQQWIGTIRNLQKKGVSAVEIEWSGVISALEQDPASLMHLDDLLAFISDRPPCELVLQRYITDAYVPHVHYERQRRPTESPIARVRHGRREVRLLCYQDRTFGLCIWLHLEVDNGLFGQHRYWSLSVPRGGKKLAAHPVGRSFASGQEAMAYGRTLVERMALRLAKDGFVGQTKNVNQFARFVLPGGEHYTEWLITAPHLHDKYWGEHFDISNIVAHVRTTSRITSEGVRLLVLEEIQSDWNQSLRKAIREARDRQPVDDGDRDLIEWDDELEPPPLNPYLNHWLEAALRMMLLLAANEGFGGIAWLPGKLHVERFPWANAEGLKAFYDRIVPSAVEKLAKSWGARVNEAQISTMTRRFIVQKVEGETTWQVWNLESGSVVGGEYSDFHQAEAFRRSNEISTLESVTALYLSDEMRADIRKDGLPYLGAIGKRLVAN